MFDCYHYFVLPDPVKSVYYKDNFTEFCNVIFYGKDKELFLFYYVR